MHLNRLKTTTKQAGMSLMETIMVISIVMVMIISVFVFYKSASDSAKVADAAKNLGLLVSSIRNTFQMQGSYLGLTNQIALQSNGFPDSMRSSLTTNNEIKSPWHSDGVVIATVTGDDFFTVTFNHVPKNSCSDLATKTYKQAARIKINSGSESDIEAATTNFSVTQAVTDCNAALNTIMWTYR